jgi:uncharacterized protein YndB with AHSA1/START domain
MAEPSAAGVAELRFTRVFDAPRRLVFRCMIDPAHLAHFWGPKGTSTPMETITVDARPGGVFETVMVNDADGSRYPTRAIYDIVDEPETLAWTETGSGMKVTIRFVALGESRTQVEIHEVGVPASALTPQAQAGFLTSLDRFEIYLTQPNPPAHGGLK